MQFSMVDIHRCWYFV